MSELGRRPDLPPCLCRVEQPGGDEEVVESLESEAVGSPERVVIEPRQTMDAEPGTAVVPGGTAEESAEKSATRVLGGQDSGSVERAARQDRLRTKTIVERLEERLCETVDGDVQQAARPAASGVGPDEE